MDKLSRLSRFSRQSQACNANAPRDSPLAVRDSRVSRWRTVTLRPGHEIPNKAGRLMMLAPTAENPKARLAKAALWGGLFTLAAIYLFATRPEPLADNAIAERSVSTE